MLTITEKNNKIYIVQDSREYKKSLASRILILLLVTLAMRLVYLDSHESTYFLYFFMFFFFKEIIILRKKTKITLDLNEKNIITKKEKIEILELFLMGDINLIVALLLILFKIK